MVLKEIGLKNVDSIHVFQDEVSEAVSFEHGSKPSRSSNERKLLASRVAICFSRTVAYGVS
jgi:hypothetical protein